MLAYPHDHHLQLQDGNCHPYLEDEETESRRAKMNFPKSRRQALLIISLSPKYASKLERRKGSREKQAEGHTLKVQEIRILSQHEEAQKLHHLNSEHQVGCQWHLRKFWFPTRQGNSSAPSQSSTAVTLFRKGNI